MGWISSRPLGSAYLYINKTPVGIEAQLQMGVPLCGVLVCVCCTVYFTLASGWTLIGFSKWGFLVVVDILSIPTLLRKDATCSFLVNHCYFLFTFPCLAMVKVDIIDSHRRISKMVVYAFELDCSYRVPFVFHYTPFRNGLYCGQFI